MVSAPLKRTLVLFDVDGTLLDSADGISDIMAEAFHAAGETPPPAAAVRGLIGLSLPEMIDAVTAPLPCDVREKILNGYRLRYFDMVEHLVELPVYRGAASTLGRLSDMGFVLGVATGKARRSTSYLLSEMNWWPYFHTIQCAEGNASKPATSMVRHALKETGRRPEETIMVGDSRYDMQMAKAAGVTAVGVAWGYTSGLELMREGAAAVAQSFDHLVDILIGLDAEIGPGFCATDPARGASHASGGTTGLPDRTRVRVLQDEDLADR